MLFKFDLLIYYFEKLLRRNTRWKEITKNGMVVEFSIDLGRKFHRFTFPNRLFSNRNFFPPGGDSGPGLGFRNTVGTFHRKTSEFPFWRFWAQETKYRGNTAN